ncbi:MAG: 50S ribosomal protein L17 [Candidatus Omnitrophica bacterium]|nr:50S ribosomal protein L17 [Candidatus Omnitrophota bacterium]
MRHGISGNKFGRNQTLRKATVRDLAKAIFNHQRIRTTRAKAAEARKLIDKLITMGKENTLAAKRRAFAILCDHALVSTLFNTIAPRFNSRHGGYTRIIKFAVNRPGDNAEMVLLELTEKGPEATAETTETVKAAENPKEAKAAKVGKVAKKAKGEAEDATIVEAKPAEKKAKPVKKAKA